MRLNKYFFPQLFAGCDRNVVLTDMVRTDSVFPQLFAGAYGIRYDAKTNLHYMRYRWYSQTQMRFVSLDLIRNANRYSYTNGNPIMYVDPTGLKRKLIRIEFTVNGNKEHIDIDHTVDDLRERGSYTLRENNDPNRPVVKSKYVSHVFKNVISDRIIKTQQHPTIIFADLNWADRDSFIEVCHSFATGGHDIGFDEKVIDKFVSSDSFEKRPPSKTEFENLQEGDILRFGMHTAIVFAVTPTAAWFIERDGNGPVVVYSYEGGMNFVYKPLSIHRPIKGRAPTFIFDNGSVRAFPHIFLKVKYPNIYNAIHKNDLESLENLIWNKHDKNAFIRHFIDAFKKLFDPCKK